jgi:lytic murein transglycosylase
VRVRGFGGGVNHLFTRFGDSAGMSIIRTAISAFARSTMGALALAAILAIPAAATAVAQPDYRACFSQIRGQAQQAGVTAATFDRVMGSVTPDREVLQFLDRQPEFRTPIWDYLAGLVDEERVEDGRRMMQRYHRELAAAEERFDVPATVIAAIWGVESNYGQNMGRRPLLESLPALACEGRRQSFFRGELVATLRIIQNGDIPASDLRGSWAGAFGQTQFIPSTFLRVAVDMTGDGRRDIINAVADALGSTAAYLSRSRWQSGLRWGYEVQLPRGFNASLAGRDKKRDIDFWRQQGVRMMDGANLPGSGVRAVLLPAGIEGPAFLVSRNFDAIFSYNHAESYALAIALLADRIAGLPGIQTPWPTDDPPLSRAERREVQERLIRAGYDIGDVDGIIGSRTREAVRDMQSRLGMEATGRAGGKLLQAMRGR